VYTTSLRKVGGSVMMAVPPALLEMLHLEAGQTMGIAVDGERLVLQRKPRPKYTLDDLLAQCDPNAPLNEEDREWLDSPPVGRELI
jgi:antitoxin ChpS